MVLAGTGPPSMVGSVGREDLGPGSMPRGYNERPGRAMPRSGDRERAEAGLVLDSAPVLSAPCRPPSAGHPHWKELLRACAATNSCSSSARTSPDDKSQAVIDRTTRQIVAAGGQIVKVAPWGRRRLAYPIDRHREGSYHIILFEAPAEAIAELEHSLLITEEVLRHLVTRVERPAKAGRADGADDVDELDDDDLPSGRRTRRTTRRRPELIDESESEAAPAAID